MNHPPSTAVASAPLAVSVVEAGRLLGIGRTLSYHLIQTGELRAVHLGRRVVIPMSEIRRLLDANTDHPATPATETVS